MPISATLHRLALREEAQCRRADQRSSDDIAQRRAEPQPAEKRDEEKRDAEHHAPRHGAGRRLQPSERYPRLGRIHCGQQRSEGKQDCAVASLPRAGGRQRHNARPRLMIFMLARQPAADVEHCIRHLSVIPAVAVALDERR